MYVQGLTYHITILRISVSFPCDISVISLHYMCALSLHYPRSAVLLCCRCYVPALYLLAPYIIPVLYPCVTLLNPTDMQVLSLCYSCSITAIPLGIFPWLLWYPAISIHYPSLTSPYPCVIPALSMRYPYPDYFTLTLQHPSTIPVISLRYLIIIPALCLLYSSIDPLLYSNWITITNTFYIDSRVVLILLILCHIKYNLPIIVQIERRKHKAVGRYSGIDVNVHDQVSQSEDWICIIFYMLQCTVNEAIFWLWILVTFAY